MFRDLGKSLANILTFSRLLSSPFVFLLILARREDFGASWYLFVLSFIIGGSDLLDGILARHYQSTSRWGAFFDPLADKVVVLGSLLCFMFVDRYWIVPVLLICGREALIGGLRFYHALKGYTVPASKLAKIKTTFQGLTLTLAALPSIVEYNTVHVIFIWTTTVFTLVTGIEYLLAIPKIHKSKNTESKNTESKNTGEERI